MWQKEVSDYRDESYYLFNDAINNYRARLQQLYNRGMIESWIATGDLASKSLWSAEETMSYFEKLPYPENETERKIWLAGFNSTRLRNTPSTNKREVTLPKQIVEPAYELAG